MDIDYQKLHDAFFKYQTKPPVTGFGEMCVSTVHFAYLFWLSCTGTMKGKSSRRRWKKNDLEIFLLNLLRPCRFRHLHPLPGSSACNVLDLHLVTLLSVFQVWMHRFRKGASLVVVLRTQTEVCLFPVRNGDSIQEVGVNRHWMSITDLFMETCLESCRRRMTPELVLTTFLFSEKFNSYEPVLF